MPGHEDKMPFGNRPNGIYIPRFRNVKTKQKDFLRGYGYQGGGTREGWSRAQHMAGFGAEFKKAISQPGPWTMSIGGFGECLPNHEQLRRNRQGKSRRLGNPYSEDSYAWGENESAMSRDIAIQAAEMLAAAGATEISVFQYHDAAGTRDSRIGYRPNGPRSQDLRAERSQPGARREESIHDRRRVHGFLRPA